MAAYLGGLILLLIVLALLGPKRLKLIFIQFKLFRRILGGKYYKIYKLTPSSWIKHYWDTEVDTRNEISEKEESY